MKKVPAEFRGFLAALPGCSPPAGLLAATTSTVSTSTIGPSTGHWCRLPLAGEGARGPVRTTGEFLQAKLRVGDTEFDSILRAIRSQLR
jgi:hypothetical protein